MKTKARFIRSITTAAGQSDAVLPWTRGQRRAAFIAQRDETTQKARKSG